MSDLNKAAKAYFDKNKNANEVHVTIDGTVFETKNYADLHAAGLKKRDEKTFNRSELVKETVSTSKQGAQAPEGTKQTENGTEGTDPAAGQTTVGPKSALLTKAEDIIALLEATSDMEVVKAYATAENDRKKPRVSVLDTIAAKTEDLTKEA